MHRFILLACAIACASAPAEPPTDPLPPAPIVLFASSADLVEPLERAARRIENASGIVVSVTRELQNGQSVIPCFWTDLDEWHGVYSTDGWLAIERNRTTDEIETTVLHETFHALGVGHLGTGEVLMHDHEARPYITDIDLAALCNVQACTVFTPERYINH